LIHEDHEERVIAARLPHQRSMAR